ncbi:MAG: zinc metallopeptidase [Clostridia bacterium]|nr:zinc metallopeptidase [Clostridia bacterium]
MKKWQEILYLHPKIKRNLLKRVYYFTEVWYIMGEVIMEYSYFLFLLLLVPCMIFSAVASAKVSSTYSKYDKIPCLSRMTGYDTATALLRNRGVSDISVGIVKGTLTDHYDPTKSIVNLSQSTFGSASVGACAVAGHEIGHVMQKKQGYFPYKLRKILVPITNIGSRLAMPVIIVGIFLDLFLFATKDQPYGQWILYVGIALYGLSTLFALVTLPVEFNASRRAKNMLVEDGVLSPEEVKGAKKVLNAAAMTYVASLLTSLVYFIRIFIMLFLLFGRKK